MKTSYICKICGHRRVFEHDAERSEVYQRAYDVNFALLTCNPCFDKWEAKFRREQQRQRPGRIIRFPDKRSPRRNYVDRNAGTWNAGKAHLYA